MSKFKWLLSVFSTPDSIDRFEKMRACSGALFGISLAGMCSYLLLGNTPGSVALIAPMGASAVLLFGVPASPLAQPWSIMGGNLVAALIGVTCAKLIGEPVPAAALAVSLSIAAMFSLRCLHPPSGAVALTAVLGGPAVHAMGYGFVISPVGLNSLLLLLTALFFNNATGRRYPNFVGVERINARVTTDSLPTARVGTTPEDLDAVLARYNQVLDISRADLESILFETERQAYLRRFGVIKCADVMSKDVISVEFSTELQSAWDLLLKYRLTALPVVDRAKRVMGIITKDTIAAQASHGNYEGFSQRLALFLRPTLHSHSIKPEVVGQIMHKDVILATEDQPIVELVTRMSDAGFHSIPVVNDTGRLVGIMTQSDMIAALYEKSVHETSNATMAPSVKQRNRIEPSASIERTS